MVGKDVRMAELFARRLIRSGSLVFRPGLPQGSQRGRPLAGSALLAWQLKPSIGALVVVLLLAATAWPAYSAQSALPQAPGLAGTSQAPRPAPDLNPDDQSPLTPKQQREIMKSNFEKMKRDANELAGLAKSLQQDLNKSNQNVLSLKVLDRAEKIEKLARKIKTEAKGD